MFYKLFFLTCFVLSCSGDRFVDECGLVGKANPIVRGPSQDVPGERFPWHVAIYEDRGSKNKRNKVLICGGSIVRSNVVITAANCFSQSFIISPVIVSAYQIVAGTANSSYDSQDPNRQVKEVHQVHIADKYGGGERSWQADIAVVVLKDSFTLSSTVRAVCLELQDSDWQTSLGTYGRVNGWGSPAAAHGLRIFTVPAISDSDCFKKMPSNYVMYVTSDKICAGMENGPTVCPGDGGGGLVFQQVTAAGSAQRAARAWYLRGVLSNAPRSTNLSNPCSPSPLALYTNVVTHIYWITNLLEALPPTTEAETVIPEPIPAQRPRTSPWQNRYRTSGQPRPSDVTTFSPYRRMT